MENKNNNLSVWAKSLSNAYTKFEAINPEKANAELGFARQFFQKNPELQKCEPQSILDAVVNVARTSVTLNPVMRLAYLIARKGKCMLEFSYMGLVAMLRDYGCIKSISAHIVFEDEDFEFEISENKIKHRPKFAKSELEHNKREIIGCYSRATLLNNDIVYEFMPMWEIMKVKSKSLGSNSEYSPWNTWRDEMIKKTVIKRHFKLLISLNPHEVLTQAMAIENENNPLLDDFNSDKTIYSIETAFDFVEENQEQEQKVEIKEEPKTIHVEPTIESSFEKAVEIVVENPIETVKTKDLDWEIPNKAYSVNDDEDKIEENHQDEDLEEEEEEEEDISFDFPDNDEDDEEDNQPTLF